MSPLEEVQWIELVLSFNEFLLLILIWLDGRVMRDSAVRTEKLYEGWFNERRSERASRQASAAKARETKAQKAAMVANDLAKGGPSAPVGRESEVGQPADLAVDGGNSGTEARTSDPLVNG